jgi:hypothetical protein
MKIKSITTREDGIENTHITEEHLGANVILEIHTLNPQNTLPELISRGEILESIYKDWLKQL